MGEYHNSFRVAREACQGRRGAGERKRGAAAAPEAMFADRRRGTVNKAIRGFKDFTYVYQANLALIHVVEGIAGADESSRRSTAP